MKKWYYWLYLALAFAVGGVLNYLDGRQIIASVIQVSITVILAFIQFLCNKNGAKGDKVFKYISMAVTISLIIWLVYLVINIFG